MVCVLQPIDNSNLSFNPTNSLCCLQLTSMHDRLLSVTSTIVGNTYMQLTFHGHHAAVAEAIPGRGTVCRKLLSLHSHTIYHTVPYHIIPYHTVPYHNIPYHGRSHTLHLQCLQDAACLAGAVLMCAFTAAGPCSMWLLLLMCTTVQQCSAITAQQQHSTNGIG